MEDQGVTDPQRETQIGQVIYKKLVEPTHGPHMHDEKFQKGRNE